MLLADASGAGAGVGIGLVFLVLGIIAFGGFILGIWALVDALGKPDWVWQQSGENKTTYIVMFVLGFVVCQLIGFVAAIVYFNSVRPKLRSIEAGGYRAVGGLGYAGMGTYGAGAGAPPAGYGAYGGYSSPAYGQQPGAAPSGGFPGYDEFGLPLEMPLGGSASAPPAPAPPGPPGAPSAPPPGAPVYQPYGQQPGGYDLGPYGQQPPQPPGGFDPGAQAPPAYPPYGQQPGGYDPGSYGQQPAGEPGSWTPEPPASPPAEGSPDDSPPPGDNSGWPT